MFYYPNDRLNPPDHPNTLSANAEMSMPFIRDSIGIGVSKPYVELFGKLSGLVAFSNQPVHFDKDQSDTTSALSSTEHVTIRLVRI
jgi:hypothetical protein